MKVEELNLNQWTDLLEEYKQTPNFRPGAAMRIENTPFTTARYFGGMTYNGDSYTYFEPVIPGEKPNEDGSPYVAWLMVRCDFLKWVTAKLKKAATRPQKGLGGPGSHIPPSQGGEGPTGASTGIPGDI